MDGIKRVEARARSLRPALIVAAGALLLIVLLLTIGRGSASAAVPGGGWEYVSNNAPVPAWEWNSAAYQWTGIELKPGQPLYTRPFAAGWTLGQRAGDARYVAVSPRYLRTWTCDGPGQWVQTTEDRTMRRWNAASSDVLGYVPAGSWVWRYCTNSFTSGDVAPDAVFCLALTCGPDRFELVNASPQPACLNSTPRCMMPIPVGGFPAKDGYLLIPRQLRPSPPPAP